MIRSRSKRPRVALLVETSRGYGRDLLVGIANYLRIHGPWSVEFEEGDPCDSVPEWLRRWKGDGVLARIRTHEMAATISSFKVPVVDLYGWLPEVKFPTLYSDEYAVGRMAAEHLMERGFRRFAFCGFGTVWSDLRREGFERHIAQAGFSCQVYNKPFGSINVESGEYEEHDAKSEKQLNRWLESLPKPIGLMAGNDSRARQVIDGCEQLGLTVPEDVAVIGVDNDEIFCELSDLPLSSVILNTRRIGFEAAALLGRMMKGEQHTRQTVLVEPRGIAVRRSTEVLAVEDRHIAAALRLIREHACEGAGVMDLLKSVPMSRSSLERQFIKLLGRTPQQEVLRIRLERASQLLMDSDLPLSLIAEKAGFKYPEYFSRLFKRKQGMTPGQFRAQNQIVGRMRTELEGEAGQP